jgi:hypothetical protein
MDVRALTRLPIALLEPAISTKDTYVDGIVTLIWPYASFTESMSVLLVDPDFRLRERKGQIRITFRGSSARAVARAGIFSGDRLAVRLAGVSWREEDVSLHTPGKGAGWELGFGQHVTLQVGTHRLFGDEGKPVTLKNRSPEARTSRS